MTDQQAEAGDVTFRDRKAGLMGWGIVHLFFGAICILFLILMGVGMAAMQTLAKGTEASPPSTGMLLPGLLVYGLLAAWFIFVGISSIRCRRWVPPVVSALAWIGLVGGVLSLVFMALILPNMYQQMGATGQMPENVATVMTVFMMVFMALIYVLLPALILLFYSRRDVAATCRARDLNPRWTDGIPIPVLALSLLFCIWAACLPILGVYGWAFPFFGIILGGGTGAVAVAVSSILSLAVGCGLARLRSEAWVGALVLTAAWCVSGYLTFRNMPLMDLYKKMQMPEDQLLLLEQMEMPGMNTLMLGYGLGALVLVGALLYSHRFFKRID